MSDCNQIKNRNHIIKYVAPNSPSYKAGIRVGDIIVSIDDNPIVDIFDFRYDSLRENPVIEIVRKDVEMKIQVIKSEEEDLGIEFENGLMDDYRRCKNNCIFCFIDQMPKGMRETLYFKDDDSRLSFLQGNYVTLTNLSDVDVERIIKFRMEPVNISFQTTNPELRVKMLNNRFAGDALKIADRLFEAGIRMNGQIVLCKGINDGDELKRTIEDLSRYLPVLESVSIVPVGLTKYREGLYPLESFNKQDAEKLIDMLLPYQKKFYDEFGLHFIHASDEWYILARREVPGEECYDGYLQLENGVGMIRLLIDEFAIALKNEGPRGLRKLLMKPYEATFVTGFLAYPYIKMMADRVMSIYPKINLDVVPIENEFFGEKITVSGLLTGGDIVNQLKEHGVKKNIILPSNVLKADCPVFLDDMTLSEFEANFESKVYISKPGGLDLFNKMIGRL